MGSIATSDSFYEPSALYSNTFDKKFNKKKKTKGKLNKTKTRNEKHNVEQELRHSPLNG